MLTAEELYTVPPRESGSGLSDSAQIGILYINGSEARVGVTIRPGHTLLHMKN